MTTARREYIERLRDQLDEWNREIDKLTREAGVFSAKKEVEIRGKLREIRSRRDRLQHDLARLKEVDDEGWGDLTKGVDQAWTRIEEALGQIAESVRG